MRTAPNIIIDLLKKDSNNLYHLYEKSVLCKGQQTYFFIRKINADSQYPDSFKSFAGCKLFGVYSENKKACFQHEAVFEPEISCIKKTDSGIIKELKLYPANSKNLSELKKIFSHLCPSALKTKPSFGFGDRLGIATPGHIKAINMHKDIFPVFAQQSIRELTKTSRTYRDVIDTAAWSIFQEGYCGKWGADADHLKEKEHLLDAIESGCTMFTIDTSGHLNENALSGKSGTICKNNKIGNNENTGEINNLKELLNRYLNKKMKLGNYVVEFDEDIISNLFFVYGRAIDFVLEIYNFIKQNIFSFDFEVSFDETSTVTSPQAHFFIINEMRQKDIDFTSLALRFPGEFFKGVDYAGDSEEFCRSIEIHGEITKQAGNYKLSLHSGSDKFSIYPDFYKYSNGNFHVKTSGTSWLESLHVIAECSPDIFRQIYDIAFESFEINKKDYHLILELSELPKSISNIKDDKLSGLLSNNRIRQCLHISYGTVLDRIGKALYGVLNTNEEKHYQFVASYLNRHLDLLK